MALQSYRELDAWKKAMALAEAGYLAIREMPPEEKYGLTSQIRRALVSVPANIAEGYGRLHRGEYVHHLSIARGSLFEVETLFALAVRLKLLTDRVTAPCASLAQDVSQILHKLIASLSPKG